MHSFTAFRKIMKMDGEFKNFRTSIRPTEGGVTQMINDAGER